MQSDRAKINELMKRADLLNSNQELPVSEDVVSTLLQRDDLVEQKLNEIKTDD